MRVGGAISFAVHLGIAAAGLIVAPSMDFESTPMIIIPVELVTIAESTNIAPITEKADEEDKAAEEEVTENIMAASAPKVEEDTVALPSVTPPPPKKPEPDVKKSDAKPTAKAEKSFLDELDGILAGVVKDPPKPSRNASAETASNTSTGAPRVGAGDMKRMTATVTDFIRTQLIRNRCWTDHSDMADARRLRTVIRVRFGRDGRFLEEPRLMDPSREPSNDPPLQVFVQHARRALDKCNSLGFQVPEEYFRVQPAQYIDIEFLPKIGAQ